MHFAATHLLQLRDAPKAPPACPSQRPIHRPVTWKAETKLEVYALLPLDANLGPIQRGPCISRSLIYVIYGWVFFLTFLNQKACLRSMFCGYVSGVCFGVLNYVLRLSPPVEIPDWGVCFAEAFRVCFGLCFDKVELPSLTESWAGKKNPNPCMHALYIQMLVPQIDHRGYPQILVNCT